MESFASTTETLAASGWPLTSHFDLRPHSSGRCDAAEERGNSRSMPLIRISEPDLVPELVASLRDVGCLATRVQANACVVSLPFGDDVYLAVELRFFLKTWLLERSAVTAEVLV